MRLSPDGTQLAYVSAESGRNELYVAGFPSLSGKRRISAEGAADPSWRPDGHELFFRARDGTMMSARFPHGPGGESATPGAPFKLTPQEQHGQYVALENGQKFLVLEPAGRRGSASEIHVVLNWWADIAR
jgi:hypothetical protein